MITFCDLKINRLRLSRPHRENTARTMAKTVRTKEGEILRVSKDEAARIVADGGRYLDKAAWNRHRAKLSKESSHATEAAH